MNWLKSAFGFSKPSPKKPLKKEQARSPLKDVSSELKTMRLKRIREDDADVVHDTACNREMVQSNKFLAFDSRQELVQYARTVYGKDMDKTLCEDKHYKSGDSVRLICDAGCDFKLSSNRSTVTGKFLISKKSIQQESASKVDHLLT